MPSLFARPAYVFAAAVVLRAALLLYGLWQDAHSAFKYTDIDYLVFTDAARAVARGQSPYERETYRYTPLLAWLLVPTAWGGSELSQACWFSSGKLMFAAGDLLAGWLIYRILRQHQGMPAPRALKFASIWLLNPMVATISTRGSSEGLLGALVMALLWAVLQRRVVLAAILLGAAVHFKIYPFIYAPAIIWWLDDENLGRGVRGPTDGSVGARLRRFVNAERVTLTVVSLLTFAGLNGVMYYIYGFPFLQHTYLYHVTRLDHRHNFSPYNTLLYLNSYTRVSVPASLSTSLLASTALHIETIALLPQLLLSALILPLTLAKRDLAGTLLAQTLAFVAFNKVCTSQYFLWYLVFLPLYLPRSRLLGAGFSGAGPALLAAWIATQALWLFYAAQLEFQGRSTFYPYLFVASLLFFAANVEVLARVVRDVRGMPVPRLLAGVKP